MLTASGAPMKRINVDQAQKNEESRQRQRIMFPDIVLLPRVRELALRRAAEKKECIDVLAPSQPAPIPVGNVKTFTKQHTEHMTTDMGLVNVPIRKPRVINMSSKAAGITKSPNIGNFAIEQKPRIFNLSSPDDAVGYKQCIQFPNIETPSLQLESQSLELEGFKEADIQEAIRVSLLDCDAVEGNDACPLSGIDMSIFVGAPEKEEEDVIELPPDTCHDKQPICVDYTTTKLRIIVKDIPFDRSAPFPDQMRQALAADRKYFAELHRSVMRRPDVEFQFFSGKREDIETIGRGQWLSDEIIESIANKVTAELKAQIQGELEVIRPHATMGRKFFDAEPDEARKEFNRYYTRTFLKNPSKKDFRLLITVSNGSHWYVVCINHKTKHIDVFDSLGDATSHRMKVAEAMSLIQNAYIDLYGVASEARERFDSEDWKAGELHKLISPQKNNHDCGVFSSLYIIAILNMAKAEQQTGGPADPAPHFAFTQANMRDFRQFILHRIIAT